MIDEILRDSCSWTLQEPQTERREHQDNPDVYYQSLPEPVPEEQDVHANDDGYEREHVKHDGCVFSHRFFLLCVTLSTTSESLEIQRVGEPAVAEVCVGTPAEH
jgi:hypothetical protein